MLKYKCNKQQSFYRGEDIEPLGETYSNSTVGLEDAKLRTTLPYWTAARFH